MKRSLATLAVVVVAVSLLAGCDVSTLGRPDDPVVLTGAALPGLLGADPARVVAFAHSRTDAGPAWRAIPVQIDQRKVVDFGGQPSSNATAGVTGTVYGTAPVGQAVLQYADPGTWVGADGDATFDADDELVFYAGDAGGLPRDGEETEPAHVVPGSGVAVRVTDPLGDGAEGWVHLFRSDGTLSPGAGRDDVSYSFVPTAGPYKTTYKRAQGPNPETSQVTTAAYRIGFTDRWYEDRWQVVAGGASGVDMLDGIKNQFLLNYCGRSNKTFNEGEGAFVANLDGPVRAIRSYIGANSGPLTQRTHVFYRTREVITTDLRVHAIPAVMDLVDPGPGAVGMTYRSSLVPAGVTIDGVPDGLPESIPAWELWSGSQGSVYVDVTWASDIPNFLAGVRWYTQDQYDVADAQCWGDPHNLGLAGSFVTAAIPNTDPRTVPSNSLSTTRTVEFGAPGATAASAQAWSDRRDRPLTATAGPYQP